jgi:ABC-type xylose transport system substrate-binding protein
MAEDRVTIDTDTLLDNIGDRQVEFSGEASGDRYDFAVQYDVLEALSARIPDGDGAAIFQQHADEIARAAARALARSDLIGRITVSGNDLEQPWPAERPHITG